MLFTEMFLNDMNAISIVYKVNCLVSQIVKKCKVLFFGYCKSYYLKEAYESGSKFSGLSIKML